MGQLRSPRSTFSVSWKDYRRRKGLIARRTSATVYRQTLRPSLRRTAKVTFVASEVIILAVRYTSEIVEKPRQVLCNCIPLFILHQVGWGQLPIRLIKCLSIVETLKSSNEPKTRSAAGDGLAEFARTTRQSQRKFFIGLLFFTRLATDKLLYTYLFVLFIYFIHSVGDPSTWRFICCRTFSCRRWRRLHLAPSTRRKPLMFGVY